MQNGFMKIFHTEQQLLLRLNTKKDRRNISVTEFSDICVIQLNKHSCMLNQEEFKMSIWGIVAIVAGILFFIMIGISCCTMSGVSEKEEEQNEKWRKELNKKRNQKKDVQNEEDIK